MTEYPARWAGGVASCSSRASHSLCVAWDQASKGGYGSPVESIAGGTSEEPRGYMEGGGFVAHSFWRPLEERTGRRSFIDFEVEVS